MDESKVKLLAVFIIGLLIGIALHSAYTWKPEGILVITDSLVEYNRMGGLSVKYHPVNDSENFIIRTGVKTLGERYVGEKLFKQELVVSFEENITVIKNGEKVYTHPAGTGSDFSTDIGVKVRVSNPRENIIDIIIEKEGERLELYATSPGFIQIVKDGTLIRTWKRGAI